MINQCDLIQYETELYNCFSLEILGIDKIRLEEENFLEFRFVKLLAFQKASDHLRALKAFDCFASPALELFCFELKKFFIFTKTLEAF
jgi:hypothetical protein